MSGDGGGWSVGFAGSNSTCNFINIRKVPHFIYRETSEAQKKKIRAILYDVIRGNSFKGSIFR